MTEDNGAGYRQVIRLLPSELRAAAEALPAERRTAVEEIRLRVGAGISVLSSGTEIQLLSGGRRAVVSSEHIRRLLDAATDYSVHSSMERIKNGFVTVEGGHRVGLCGSAVVKGGEVVNLTAFSSASIRLARQRYGFADKLTEYYTMRGGFASTLIVSPPGFGKTTLLRDLVRQLSTGTRTLKPMRVGLADERREISAMHDGVAQLDVGPHTDVMTDCPFCAASEMLTRTMNPQILAADEITSAKDVDATERAANCGVLLLATAHASSVEELGARPLYRRLLALGAFSVAAVIGPGRNIKIKELD